MNARDFTICALIKAANGPSFGRVLGVGMAGALPAKLLVGMPLSMGVHALNEAAGKQIDPKIIDVIGNLLSYGSAAAGGIYAQHLDGQFDRDNWDPSGKKIRRKIHRTIES